MFIYFVISLKLSAKIAFLLLGRPYLVICDPPQDFNAKGESTRTTLKQKNLF